LGISRAGQRVAPLSAPVDWLGSFQNLSLDVSGFVAVAVPDAA